MKLISIVLPVYNVEKYLTECLDSIVVLRNFYENLELIVVDDGSIDGSGGICDEYSELHKWISTFHISNGGLSAARNYGLSKTSGEYIWFIDSDDLIENQEEISKRLEKINKEDCILFDYLKFNDLTRRQITNCEYHLKENFFKEPVLYTLMSNNWIPKSVWTMVVKKKLIMNRKIMFEVNRLSEDTDWILQVLLNARHVRTCEISAYKYRVNRTGSITKKNNYRLIDDSLKTISKWRETTSSLSNTDQIAILNHLVFIYATLFTFIDNETPQSTLNYLKKNDDLFDYNENKNKRVAIIKVIYKIGGVYMASKASKIGSRIMRRS